MDTRQRRRRYPKGDLFHKGLTHEVRKQHIRYMTDDQYLKITKCQDKGCPIFSGFRYCDAERYLKRYYVYGWNGEKI